MTAPLRTSRHAAGDGVVVLTATGEIDIGNCGRLRAELVAAASPPTRLLVCDLSEVPFLGCCGLSALLDVESTVDCEVRVVATAPIVRRVFAAAGLLERFGVVDSLAAGLRDAH